MATSPVDLFTPIVPENRWHPAFRALLRSSAHSDAREHMSTIAQRMGDPDGNLVVEFQSGAFHARLFELACFAYLEEQGLSIDRKNARPDFTVENEGRRFSVEAVTANAPDSLGGQLRDISILNLELTDEAEISAKCNDEFPIRVGGVLRSKLAKEYWKLPHCSGHPLVLAVGPFHEPGSVTYIDLSLARYLYGLEGAEIADGVQGQIPVRGHSYRGKSIPSNFFGYPNAQHVSAVLYCNQFTVPRFFRMAAQTMGTPPGTSIFRDGECFLPQNPQQVVHYGYMLGDEDAPVETWSQGVTVFHNPNALHPLDDGALACTSSFRIQGVLMWRRVHDFHPVTSRMLCHVPEQ